MDGETNKRLLRAALFLKNDIKKSLSKKMKRKKKKVVGRSSPGNAPFLESGELRRSLAHEIDKKNHIARVGTNKIYAKELELPKRLNRPFILPALKRNRGKVTRILIGKKMV